MQYVKCLNFFQDLLKAKALERGRLLGLDVGDKYVGLAVSDLDNKIATPLRYGVVFFFFFYMLLISSIFQLFGLNVETSFEGVIIEFIIRSLGIIKHLKNVEVV